MDRSVTIGKYAGFQALLQAFRSLQGQDSTSVSEFLLSLRDCVYIHGQRSEVEHGGGVGLSHK